MRYLMLSALVFLSASIALPQTGTLLHSCESLDDAHLSLGGDREGSELHVTYAAEHVTEGVGGIMVIGHSPADADGNTYVAFDLVIEPTDFTEQCLLFDATTTTHDRSKALYVRGFDADGDCVLSWASWQGELQAQMRGFALSPGEGAGTIHWEDQRIESEDRSAVTRLRFITGTHEKGVDFTLIVDNVRVGEAVPK